MKGGGGYGGAEQAIRESTAQSVGELRRQYDETKGILSPYTQAGEGALPGVIEGASLEGFVKNLEQIMDTDIFHNVLGESRRYLESTASASGLGGMSGDFFKSASEMPLDVAMGIEGQQYGRLAGLAGMGSSAATSLAGFSSTTGTNIASAYQSQGQGIAQTQIAKSQQEAADRQGMMNAVAMIGAAAIMAPVAPVAASDENLKVNIEKVGTIGDLNEYQWDWAPSLKDTIIAKYPTIGFMAQEVVKKYPQFVESVAGFLCINYEGLIDHLKHKFVLSEEVA